MKAPKLLPWIARKNGISEDLALKLWRRATAEAEEVMGCHDGSDYFMLAVYRFLELAEEEGERNAQRELFPGLLLFLRGNWLLRHQNRLLQLNLIAAQRTYRFWLANWRYVFFGQKSAVCRH